MSFIDKAITVLRNSGIILIPTDTHFALAADPYSPDAMEKLTLLKRSPGTREMTFCFCELADIWEWWMSARGKEAKLKCSAGPAGPAPENQPAKETASRFSSRRRRYSSGRLREKQSDANHHQPVRQAFGGHPRISAG
jgi:hypothetical protein